MAIRLQNKCHNLYNENEQQLISLEVVVEVVAPENASKNNSTPSMMVSNTKRDNKGTRSEGLRH
jgi:hypothetical protein